MLVIFGLGYFAGRAINRAHLHRERSTQLAQLRKIEELEILLESENSRLIAWPHDSSVDPLIFGSASGESDLHAPAGRFVRFEEWLEIESAARLFNAVKELRREGSGFALKLHCRNGGLVDAFGFSAGTFGAVRFRDIAADETRLEQVQLELTMLKHRLNNLLRLLDNIEGPAWQRDHDNQLIWVNGAYIAATDAENINEAIGKGIEFLDTAGRATLGRNRQSDSAFAPEMIVTAQGKRRHFDVHEVYGEGGIAGIALDAERRVALAQELERIADFHSRTLDQLTTAVAIFNSERRLKFYNGEYRDLWAMDDSFLAQEPEDGEILDRLRSQRKLPEQADYRLWRDNVLESYRAVKLREFWWHLPDGRTLRVIANPHPRGGITYIYEDVSEQLRLESRYNALIRVQGETLDHLTEAVAVFGSNGRIRLWNPAFCHIFDLPDDLLGDNPHVNQIAQWSSSDPITETWAALSQPITGLANNRTGRTGRLELPEDKVYDYHTIPLPDGGTLICFNNMTDSVRAERALVERNLALEKAAQLKNDFVEHVSYELRTPLTNIIGFSQLLNDEATGNLNVRQREYNGHVLKSSSSLLALIDDILDLATINAGAMRLEFTDVDIAKCLTGAIAGLQDRLERDQLKLENKVSADIGTIIADEKRLRQIMFNILSNAIQFSEKDGKIEIDAGRDNKWLTMSIRDFGGGIARQIRDEIFVPFVSSAQPGARRRAGLGLSIVHSFVRLHGGRISIDSVPDQGTCVTCSFLIAGPPDASDITARSQSEIDVPNIQYGSLLPSNANVNTLPTGQENTDRNP